MKKRIKTIDNRSDFLQRLKQAVGLKEARWKAARARLINNKYLPRQ